MKKLLFILLLCSSTALIFLKINSTKPGIVILLHGPSTAGKSSLKKEIQKQFSTPFLNLGIDSLFVGVLPERFVTGPAEPHDIPHANVMEGVVSHDAQGNRLFTLNIGPEGDKVIKGMHQAIKGYVHAGNNCIVDYITYKNEWIDDLCTALKGVTVYTVGIDLPIEILEAREKSRDIEAIIGHARSHHKSVHELFYKKNGYDLLITNERLTPKEIADQVTSFIKNHQHPEGFKRLATTSFGQQIQMTFNSFSEKITNLTKKVVY